MKSLDHQVDRPAILAANANRREPLKVLASVDECNRVLVGRHYLGPTKTAACGWRDEFGVMLFARPRSRRLPTDWLELVRWCLYGEKNGGSRQWSAWAKWARAHLPATTVVSYSDPSQGHTGALYRACNWQWAPTWLRLRPPPTGNGSWTADKQQASKDRWIFPLQPDDRRSQVLFVNDESIMKKMPWASYPGDYKRFIQSVN
jgi:hypothetical protein